MYVAHTLYVEDICMAGSRVLESGTYIMWRWLHAALMSQIGLLPQAGSSVAGLSSAQTNTSLVSVVLELPSLTCSNHIDASLANIIGW